MWLQRLPLVVDCSVMAALIFDEAESADAAAMLLGRSLHAPTLLPYEIASVAAKKQRGGANAHWLQSALQAFNEQLIDLHPVPPDAAAALAQRFKLSAYDAAYLWLAATLAAPLATLDKALHRAAQQHLAAPD